MNFGDRASQLSTYGSLGGKHTQTGLSETKEPVQPRDDVGTKDYYCAAKSVAQLYPLNSGSGIPEARGPVDGCVSERALRHARPYYLVTPHTQCPLLMTGAMARTQLPHQIGPAGATSAAASGA